MRICAVPTLARRASAHWSGLLTLATRLTAAPAASCSVQPSEVMVGEPVTATATRNQFNPKHTLTYTWMSNGGKVTSKDSTATIDTNGVAGGSYTVTAHIADPKMKKNGEASCTANFTVKEPPKNPPTLVLLGEPDQRSGGNAVDHHLHLHQSGQCSGHGQWMDGQRRQHLGQRQHRDPGLRPGASPGPITVSATCTDSRGLNAQAANTQVTVEVPPPPPPQASKLSSCDFPNEKKPWRVDNTCKAVLDDVAQRLQHDPDSKLVIVGNSDPSEKRKNLAGERAVDSKSYLSGGEAKQGIDASRIETRTGSGGTKTADYWIVPPGASFTGEGTQPVDENDVKAVPDHPKPAAKKEGKSESSVTNNLHDQGRSNGNARPALFHLPLGNLQG